jgi:hypothetical protein
MYPRQEERSDVKVRIKIGAEKTEERNAPQVRIEQILSAAIGMDIQEVRISIREHSSDSNGCSSVLMGDEPQRLSISQPQPPRTQASISTASSIITIAVIVMLTQGLIEVAFGALQMLLSVESYFAVVSIFVVLSGGAAWFLVWRLRGRAPPEGE